MRYGNGLRSAISLGVLVSFLTLTAACYGPFNLTRTVHKWNGQVGGAEGVPAKWMQEGIFLVLIILPVYSGAALLDALLFNSIQFWTGDNPIKVSHEGDTRPPLVQVGDTTATLTFASDAASVRVAYAKAGQVFKTVEILRAEHGYQFLDEHGRPLFSAQLNGQGLQVVDEQCRVVMEVPAAQLQLGAQRLATLQMAPAGS